jgi:hypothetical protein
MGSSDLLGRMQESQLVPGSHCTWITRSVRRTGGFVLVGISSGNQALKRCAFLVTNPGTSVAVARHAGIIAIKCELYNRWNERQYEHTPPNVRQYAIDCNVGLVLTRLWKIESRIPWA